MHCGMNTLEAFTILLLIMPPVIYLVVHAMLGALKMQDRKMTDKDIAGGGKCRTGI